ncbi:MAG: cyclic nucleotide-binding domain-containing protein [Armatimonadetes bacterium]|nr:cyclic nucleotide-binding domain-containing protein [Armatimonadota bacterium]
MSQALDIHEALRTNYLMQSLSERQIGEISAITSVKEFNGGDTILRQFAKDNDLLIILEGKARINGFSGELIAEAQPGSVIGEISLIDDKPRSATVVAVGDTKIATIPNSDLWGLMNREPEIGKELLLAISRILAARLRAANVVLDSVVERAD